jgi:hypothetical protein
MMRMKNDSEIARWNGVRAARQGAHLPAVEAELAVDRGASVS